MGLLQTIGLARKTGQPEPLAAPKEKTIQLGAGFLEILSNRALTETKTVSEKLLQAYSGWVYANVSAIAEEVSKIEFELYRVRVTRDEVEYVPVLSHPILDLLDRWNSFMTNTDAVYNIQAHMELAGDAFLLLDNPTNPQNIFLLPPDKITVIPGDPTKGEGIIRYEYKDTIDGNRIEIKYRPEEIIQIKVPNPNNPLRGKSVVEAAALAIDTDNLAGEYNKSFFKNSAVPGFVLSSDARITRDDIERISADLRRNYGGVRNAFKAMILGGGLKPVQLALSQKDMDFLKQQEWTRDKIMALFKNTKTSLGIVEDVNRANAEASQLAWKENVVRPKMSRLTDTLNEFLVPRFGESLVLGYKDPVPENREAKVTEVQMLKNANLITINEGREMVGLDPLEGEEFDTINTFDPNEAFGNEDEDEDEDEKAA